MTKAPYLIKIATGFGSFETSCLKSYLNSYGIEVMLDNSYLAGCAPHYVLAIGGLDIWVFASDWQNAVELIKIYKEEQQSAPISKKNTLHIAFSVAFWILWTVCTIPPPARGIFFTNETFIAKLMPTKPKK